MLLVVAVGLGPAGALADLRGDATDNQPDHDIVDVAFTETGNDLQFTITVAGAHRAPVAGVDELEIEFRLVKDEVYDPNLALQLGGVLHVVGATNENTYGVFRQGGFGYTLPGQPASGVSTATWVLPKAYLDATAAHRPRAGDWISNIEVHALELGVPVDTATYPDVELKVDSDPGKKYFLRDDGGDANLGELRTAAPSSATPTAATLWHQETLRGEWRTAPVNGPMKLRDLSAVLWISATSTTPVLADEVFHVDLYEEAPNGTRTLLARRVEAVSPTPGATTNLFLAPGAPQRMPFQLALVGDDDRVDSGNRLVMKVTVDGLFSSESGAIVVYHDSGSYDSFLLVGERPVPRPDRSTCPASNQVSHLPKAQC